MNKYMLDTNICIYIIKNKPAKIKEKFRTFDIGDLFLSVITVSELYYGAFKSKYIEKNISALEYFLSPFSILDFDVKASVEYGRIRSSLERKGKVIGGLDMMIAAHSRIFDMILVTNNVKEFRNVENLKIDNWV